MAYVVKRLGIKKKYIIARVYIHAIYISSIQRQKSLLMRISCNKCPNQTSMRRILLACSTSREHLLPVG